jgi:hypothetical protein
MSEKEIKLTKEEFDRLMDRDKTLTKKEDKQRNQWKRRNARLMIMTGKAEKDGHECTDKEIDTYLLTAPTKRKSV